MSNALLKSIKVERVNLFTLKFNPMSSINVAIASTVDLPGQNPYWFGDKIWFS